MENQILVNVTRKCQKERKGGWQSFFLPKILEFFNHS
jgi:hypothetical protein